MLPLQSLPSSSASPSPHSSVAPSPAPRSATPSAISVVIPPSKRQRVLSRSASSPALAPWSSIDQDVLGSHLACITASCGFPQSWVENPAVQAFFEQYFPTATPISSYCLTHTYIPRLLDGYRQTAMQRSAGELVTLQTDGWTGINSRHLVAFMMTTSPNRDVHTVAVKDVSSDRRTAAHLKNLIIDVIGKVKAEWQATVVAVTSDASGESRAARKQLLEQFPSLVTPDCYAHQV
ncbi:hypothetical protein CONPUDRAFT_53313 [Coniophora puteana RWD-64-598 SS2]|uniref:Uncharacterized protein n=1 Tax=Coniophora puteana (strain RWD-64-598) TaxID=741705 RepID=A0A5M3MWE6_CONPW|nr:uncharacterized protein CONPUDRAFT_53313 [Coniophora puteana RWD-64-598 SS2]EIW83473.1 hypothetical protein CONPUDRAFT_53313 [Coniophora puteana RWD-64-598 SS2]